jgi:hypothetical protein
MLLGGGETQFTEMSNDQSLSRVALDIGQAIEN